MTDRGSFLLSDSDANLGARLEWIGRVLCGLVDLARMPVGAIRVGPLEAERCLGAHADGRRRSCWCWLCSLLGPGFRPRAEKGKPVAGSDEMVGITVELSWTTPVAGPRKPPEPEPRFRPLLRSLWRDRRRDHRSDSLAARLGGPGYNPARTGKRRQLASWKRRHGAACVPGSR